MKRMMARQHADRIIATNGIHTVVVLGYHTRAPLYLTPDMLAPRPPFSRQLRRCVTRAIRRAGL